MGLNASIPVKYQCFILWQKTGDKLAFEECVSIFGIYCSIYPDWLLLFYFVVYWKGLGGGGLLYKSLTSLSLQVALGPTSNCGPQLTRLYASERVQVFRKERTTTSTVLSLNSILIFEQLDSTREPSAPDRIPTMTTMNLSPSKRRKHKDIAGAMFTGRGIVPIPAEAPSSSPAFGTPVHPLRPFNVATSKQAPILPILLPPPTLRPLAFRTFTKKHSLTLTSSALQELATFIGRHCGSGWREEGLAEKVLEEAARAWKGRNGGVIVDGASPELKDILKALEGNMSGGKIITSVRGLSRQNSLLLDVQQQDDDFSKARLGLRPNVGLTREDSNTSFGISALEMDENDDENIRDPRRWLKVISSLEQPRFVYNVEKKHFER